MGADAHVPRSAADGAVENVRAGEALRRFGLALAAKLEARRAADHLEPRAARQALDDVLADAVREELHLGVARQIVEGQDRENGLGGYGLRRLAARRGHGLGSAGHLGSCAILFRAPRLLRAGRRRQRCVPGRCDLADLDGVLDPGQAIAHMHGPAQERRILHADRGASCEIVGRTREENAAVPGKRHDPRRDRLGQSLHLQRLRAARHVFRRVLAKHDLAQVDADPGGHFRIERAAELAQPGLIGQRETDGLDGPLEQQQEAVALVDLSAVECGQEVPRDAVVTCQQIGSDGVADPLDELGAGDEIAQQERADRGSRDAGRGGHGSGAVDPVGGVGKVPVRRRRCPSRVQLETLLSRSGWAWRSSRAISVMLRASSATMEGSPIAAGSFMAA